MKISIQNKLGEELYGVARDYLVDAYGEGRLKAGGCVYWTHAACMVLVALGFHPYVQAGSLYWRIVPKDQDDGVMQTHFSYLWSPQQAESWFAMAVGALPEMHVWAVVPQERWLVDFSTGYLRQHVEENFKLWWRTADPPQYVFGSPPSDAIYQPNREATLVAVAALIAIKKGAVV